MQSLLLASHPRYISILQERQPKEIQSNPAKSLSTTKRLKNDFQIAAEAIAAGSPAKESEIAITNKVQKLHVLPKINTASTLATSTSLEGTKIIADDDNTMAIALPTAFERWIFHGNPHKCSNSKHIIGETSNTLDDGENNSSHLDLNSSVGDLDNIQETSMIQPSTAPPLANTNANAKENTTDHQCQVCSEFAIKKKGLDTIAKVSTLCTLYYYIEVQKI